MLAARITMVAVFALMGLAAGAARFMSHPVEAESSGALKPACLTALCDATSPDHADGVDPQVLPPGEGQHASSVLPAPSQIAPSAPAATGERRSPATSEAAQIAQELSGIRESLSSEGLGLPHVLPQTASSGSVSSFPSEPFPKNEKDQLAEPALPSEQSDRAFAARFQESVQRLAEESPYASAEDSLPQIASDAQPSNNVNLAPSLELSQPASLSGAAVGPTMPITTLPSESVLGPSSSGLPTEATSSPQQVMETSARQLRDFARRLDDIANELEDKAVYAHADSLRGIAAKMRLEARRELGWTEADAVQSQ